MTTQPIAVSAYLPSGFATKHSREISDELQAGRFAIVLDRARHLGDDDR